MAWAVITLVLWVGVWMLFIPSKTECYESYGLCHCSVCDPNWHGLQTSTDRSDRINQLLADAKWWGRIAHIGCVAERSVAPDVVNFLVDLANEEMDEFIKTPGATRHADAIEKLQTKAPDK